MKSRFSEENQQARPHRDAVQHEDQHRCALQEIHQESHGGECGDEGQHTCDQRIQRELRARFEDLRHNQDTGARKWGSPYLTREFFDIAQERLRDDMALVLAERDGRWVAGALNFIGADALYGRYWGCTEHHPCLHFELCYYRAIDLAIELGLSTVEAGAQGEHKLARGYLPTATWSVHWMRDEGFANAVGEYLQAERDAVDHEIEILTEYGPFKKVDIKEQE